STDLQCSPDGERLALSAASNADGAFRVLHLPTGRWWDPPRPPTSRAVYALAFAPDGATLAAGGAAPPVGVLDPSAGGEVGRPRCPGPWSAALAFAPDGHTLAVVDSTGVVRLWPWRRLLEGG